MNVPKPTRDILEEVARERQRQDQKFGEQNHPDGTSTVYSVMADLKRKRCQRAAKGGVVTWKDIADEEIWEAYAEIDSAALRKEVIQAAAVFVAWAEAIDRRTSIDVYGGTEP